ncbi:hypothetical protein LXL04_017750 [Taraxacum kok-saghyz]
MKTTFGVNLLSVSSAQSEWPKRRSKRKEKVKTTPFWGATVHKGHGSILGFSKCRKYLGLHSLEKDVKVDKMVFSVRGRVEVIVGGGVFAKALNEIKQRRRKKTNLRMKQKKNNAIENITQPETHTRDKKRAEEGYHKLIQHASTWQLLSRPRFKAVDVGGQNNLLERPNEEPVNFDKLETLLEKNDLAEGFGVGKGGGHTLTTSAIIIVIFLLRFEVGEVVKWTHDVPIKVMCFIWRANQGRIPTMTELEKRGIPIEDRICGYCSQVEEDCSHILWHCSFVATVWHWIFKWCDVHIPTIGNIQELFLFI